LFGGTFNPIHLGHLRVAVEVKEGFELDRVYLIPSALPPHKMPGEVADAADRQMMLNLAVDETPGLNVSDVELKRLGPSYTIDTVHHFKRALPDDSLIYLVMGLDAFLEIDTWKSYEELLAQVPFIVMNRPMAFKAGQGSEREIIENFLKSRLSENYIFYHAQLYYKLEGKQPIYIHEVSSLDISSTKIRELIKKGQSIEFLVPPKVAEFITTKGLYV
jgi:nicotinate-nucleotide adenylyltransferase